MACMIAILCAGLEAGGPAAGPRNVLAPFFKETKEKGFPLSGWAFKDGTAAVDVARGDEVTRYSFDAEGRVTAKPSPAEYGRLALRLARFSAADAAEAALVKLEDDEQVRVVTLITEGTAGMFFVAVYDGNGRFLGRHRFTLTDGRWDGYDDGMGESDPLEAE